MSRRVYPLPQVNLTHSANAPSGLGETQHVARKCHSSSMGFTLWGFTEEKPRDLMNGLRIEIPEAIATTSERKCLK
jgi:hypothetical protein